MRNFLSLMLFLPACGGPTYSNNFPVFTAMKPAVTDLTGTYVPTADSIKYIKEKGHYPDADIHIVLSQNGDFDFENIPDWWTNFGEPKGKFGSGKGKWWINEDSNNHCFNIGLGFDSSQGFKPESDGKFVTHICLVGERPPYLLHFILGDPDSGKAMQFERTPDQ